MLHVDAAGLAALSSRDVPRAGRARNMGTAVIPASTHRHRRSVTLSSDAHLAERQPTDLDRLRRSERCDVHDQPNAGNEAGAAKAAGVEW